MKNGVDLDVAMALEAHEALAWGVIFGEMEGGSYDWDLNEWKERT